MAIVYSGASQGRHDLAVRARENKTVVLFSGAAGTGKTMAAEVLARDLGRPFYRFDPAAIVSKHIGETEKNIDRAFIDAARKGAVMFFDEADALFAKRTGVKDSHDRYANLEVSYLLDRIEAFEGLVILTSNSRENLDAAALRRIKLVVDFPPS